MTCHQWQLIAVAKNSKGIQLSESKMEEFWHELCILAKEHGMLISGGFKPFD